MTPVYPLDILSGPEMIVYSPALSDILSKHPDRGIMLILDFHKLKTPMPRGKYSPAMHANHPCEKVTTGGWCFVYRRAETIYARKCHNPVLSSTVAQSISYLALNFSANQENIDGQLEAMLESFTDVAPDPVATERKKNSVLVFAFVSTDGSASTLVYAETKKFIIPPARTKGFATSKHDAIKNPRDMLRSLSPALPVEPEMVQPFKPSISSTETETDEKPNPPPRKKMSSLAMAKQRRKQQST
jgi:hypothetical protein